MKRIYSYLLLALLGVIGYSAKAATVDFTLVVDHADRLTVQTFSAGFVPIPQIIAIHDGENVVTATAEKEFNIITNSEDYDITSVTIGGVEQTITDPHFFVMYIPWDFSGTEVVVTTAEADPNGGGSGGGDIQPVDKCTVTFDFADEASKAYITGVSVYNDPVNDFLNGFEVEKGTPIELTLNTTLTTDEFTINGAEPYIMMGTVIYTVEENTVIRVKVHQFVDVNFTVIIDDASRAEIGYWVTIGSGFFQQRVFNAIELADGENHISLSPEQSTTVSVRAKGDGNAVSSVVVNGYPVEVSEETEITVAEGMVIDIYTINEQRDAVCTVICDDYTVVSLMCGATEVELTSDNQQVPFFTGKESTFVFTSKGFGTMIYGVALNGVDVPATNSAYIVEGVKDGDVINVTTVAPQVPVHFTYADDLSKQFVDRVTVMSGIGTVEVYDYNDDNFTVPQGAYVAIYANSAMEAKNVTVTGSELLVYPGSYEFSVAGETTVFIEAVEKEKTVININVDNAANVNAHYSVVTFNMIGMPVIKNVTIDLVDGDNAISFDEAPAAIVIDATEGAEINYIIVNGESVAAGVEIPVVNGMDIVVRTKKAVLNVEEGVFMVDGQFYTFFAQSVANNRVEPISVAEGNYKHDYRIFAFDADLNPYNLKSQNADATFYVYLNDEEVENSEIGYLANMFDAEVTFKAGDVLKVYDHEPFFTDFTVDFMQPADEVADKVEITVDGINKVNTAKFKVLEGTKVEIAPVADAQIAGVYLNSEEIYPVEGVYTLYVTEENPTILIDMVEVCEGVVYIKGDFYHFGASSEENNRIEPFYFEYGSYDEYSTFTFSTANNPFNLKGQNQENSFFVYLNGEEVENSPRGELAEMFDAQVNFSKNDVLKVYSVEPFVTNVAINFVQNRAKVADKVKVVMDRVVALDDLANESASKFDVLEGTEFQISAVADCEINTVTVNGVAVTAVDDVYTFAANEKGEMVILVDVKELEGINAVSVDSMVSRNVYNMQGVLLIENADAQQIAKLRPGIYIINGAKVLVK